MYDLLPMEYEETEILRKITKIHGFLAEEQLKDHEMHRLANAVQKLSVYMVNLGQMVADARMESEISEEYRKAAQRELYLKYKDEGMTDQTSKTSSEKDTEEYLEQEKVAKHKLEVLHNLRMDLDRLVSAAQSRIKTLAGDNTRSKND